MIDSLPIIFIYIIIMKIIQIFYLNSFTIYIYIDLIDIIVIHKHTHTQIDLKW